MPDLPEPAGRRPASFLVGCLVWLALAVAAAVVLWLLVGAMRGPVDAQPGRGVVTIPAPGPSGGVPHA